MGSDPVNNSEARKRKEESEVKPCFVDHARIIMYGYSLGDPIGAEANYCPECGERL